MRRIARSGPFCMPVEAMRGSKGRMRIKVEKQGVKLLDSQKKWSKETLIRKNRTEKWRNMRAARA